MLENLEKSGSESVVRRRVQCSYCGGTWYIEEEHPRARIRGGITTVPACRSCNRSKGSKSQAKWLDYLLEYDRPKWRKIRDFQKRKRSNFANLVRQRRIKEMRYV